jgi:hypothetical protein
MLVRRATWRYATLVGVALSAAYFSKLTMLLVWPVPLLAWLLLRSASRFKWTTVSRLGTAYLVGLVVSAPVVIYSLVYSDLGANQVQSSAQLDASIPTRLLQNTVQLLANVRVYAGTLVLLWLALAVIIGVIFQRRHALFVLLAAGLPLGALLAVGTENSTRYYLVGLPPLVALLGISTMLAWGWLRRIPGSAPSLVVGLALLGLAIVYWPFFKGTYADPTALLLPPSDYRTYISSYPAGFGWDATTERLQQIAAESEREIEVVAPVEGHAWRTQIALTGVPNVEVFQPEPLTGDWLAAHLAGDANVYFVREEPRPEIDWASLGVEAQLVDSFPKPDGQNWVELRHLTPVSSGNETTP